MDAEREHNSSPTRRQFVRRAIAGASLLSLGSATALLATPTPKPPSTPQARPPLNPKFTYNLPPQAQTDPAQIHFNESTPLPTGFQELRSVAIGPDGTLYAAGDQAIRLFTPLGARTADIPLDAPPRCLAFGKNNRLYVGMDRHIETFLPDRTRAAKWDALGDKAVITSIAVGDQHIFVADAGNRLVVRFDLAGKQLNTIGKKDTARNIPGFAIPSPYFEINLDADGLLWAANPANHRIEAYTPEGDLRSSWGQFTNTIDGFCGCCNPIHFTRLKDGRFITSEKGLPRVKIYSAQGQFQGLVAGPEQFPDQLNVPQAVKPCMALATDATGRVYLADASTRALRVFTPKTA
jgi:hypothetical protein